MMQYTLILLISVVLPVQGLECYIWIEANCTAHNPLYVDTCNKLMVNNRGLGTQRCHPSEDKCVAIGSRFAFQDKYSVQYMVTSCGTGFLTGCNNIDQLRAIGPQFAEIGGFSADVYTYESLDTCVCDTDYCVSFSQLQEYERRVFQTQTIEDPRSSCPGIPRPVVAIIFLLVIAFSL